MSGCINIVFSVLSLYYMVIHDSETTAVVTGNRTKSGCILKWEELQTLCCRCSSNRVYEGFYVSERVTSYCSSYYLLPALPHAKYPNPYLLQLTKEHTWACVYTPAKVLLSHKRPAHPSPSSLLCT